MDQLAGLSLEIFFDIWGSVSNHWNHCFPSRLDKTWHQRTKSKCFQIQSAIFLLVFVTILDGKQSHRFSSFANFLFLQGSNVKKYRAKQLKMSAVLGRQPSAWSPTMETKIKSPYLWIRITFLFTALICRFCCCLGSEIISSQIYLRTYENINFATMFSKNSKLFLKN